MDDAGLIPNGLNLLAFAGSHRRPEKETVIPMTPACYLRVCLVAGMLPSAALSQKIAIQYDHDADFSRYHTFAFRQGNMDNLAASGGIVQHNVEDAIRTRLSGQGLAETGEAPDLNVRFSVASASRRDVEIFLSRWRRIPQWFAARHTRGKLVIDLRDAEKRQLVWRGIAFEDKTGSPKIEHHFDDMVKKAIEKYPPKKY
jgi:hypothetical protein